MGQYSDRMGALGGVKVAIRGLLPEKGGMILVLPTKESSTVS